MDLTTELFLVWLPSALALIYLLILTTRRSYKHGRLPPGPRPLPIIGNMLTVGDKPHRSLAALAKTYGPIMSLKLGLVTTVVISSPEAARQVLQKKDHAFYGRSVPDSARALDQHEAGSAFHQVDQHWRTIRKVYATQLFAPQRINDNRNLRQKKVRELIAYLQERCEAGEAVDVGRAVFVTTLNMISNTIFSEDMVDTASTSPQYFKNILRSLLEEGGAPNLSDFYPVLAALDLQGRRRRVAALSSKMYEIFDGVIDRKLESRGREESGSDVMNSTNDFLDSLLQYQESSDGGVKIDRRVIRGLLFELFLGGGETSSSTVEWAMAELLRNPNAMSKARAEIAKTIHGEEEVDESDIPRLPYLQAVVKETLRLHAPTPFLVPRRTETDVELSGWNIPAGTRVLVNAWAIGRDEAVWAEADAFMPERFLDSSRAAIEYKGDDFKLIPFGGGRRKCPGLPLASRMVHLILASMLRSFGWKLPEGVEPRDVDLTEKFGLGLAKAIPLPAIPFVADAKLI